MAIDVPLIRIWLIIDRQDIKSAVINTTHAEIAIVSDYRLFIKFYISSRTYSCANLTVVASFAYNYVILLGHGLFKNPFYEWNIGEMLLWNHIFLSVLNILFNESYLPVDFRTILYWLFLRLSKVGKKLSTILTELE